MKNCFESRKVVSKRKGKYISFSPLLIAILPKCPFCVLAYSSTIILCSSAYETTHFSMLSLIITLVFCSLALLGILISFKGKRSVFSFATAFLGTVIIAISLIIGGGEPLYYLGTLILFAAVCYNENLFDIIRRKWASRVREKDRSFLQVK